MKVMYRGRKSLKSNKFKIATQIKNRQAFNKTDFNEKHFKIESTVYTRVQVDPRISRIEKRFGKK